MKHSINNIQTTDEFVFRSAVNLIINGYLKQAVNIKDITKLLREMADDYEKELEDNIPEM